MGITGGSSVSAGYNPFQQNMMMAGISNGLGLDPEIMKKGLEDIKEQMKDVQREAVLIEKDMEKRRNEMILKE